MSSCQTCPSSQSQRNPPVRQHRQIKRSSCRELHTRTFFQFDQPNGTKHAPVSKLPTNMSPMSCWHPAPFTPASVSPTTPGTFVNVKSLVSACGSHSPTKSDSSPHRQAASPCYGSEWSLTPSCATPMVESRDGDTTPSMSSGGWSRPMIVPTLALAGVQQVRPAPGQQLLCALPQAGCSLCRDHARLHVADCVLCCRHPWKGS
jgi:hypothetical protein